MIKPLDQDLSSKFSQDLAETKRYSDIVDYQTIARTSGLKCHKCKEFKPLRTHHCSVCN